MEKMDPMLDEKAAGRSKVSKKRSKLIRCLPLSSRKSRCRPKVSRQRRKLSLIMIWKSSNYDSENVKLGLGKCLIGVRVWNISNWKMSNY